MRSNEKTTFNTVQDEIDHLEKTDDKNMDSESDNIGSNNRTKHIKNFDSIEGVQGEKKQANANGRGKNADYQCIHNVRSGESLCLIATRYLGSGSRWTEIMRLNDKKTASIVSGEKIKIPYR